MPGARLTNEDRRRIAEWLDQGLGYAEIGRLLARPTSTISREVSRNSGAGPYRAAQAQQAADRRAGRRKPPRPAELAAGEQPAEAQRRFVDEFATLLAATGLPKMTARVFACLLTADADGLTSAELVRRLRVSPASVSKSIKSLHTMDLVLRHPDPGTRRERYVIDDDVWQRAWQTDSTAHSALAAAAEQGVATFGSETPAGIRLSALGRFFAGLSKQMTRSRLADPALHDALIVIAALVHAARSLTPTALAVALDWPRDRVDAALRALQSQPAIAAPLTLQAVGNRRFTVGTRADCLSPAQRAALARVG